MQNTSYTVQIKTGEKIELTKDFLFNLHHNQKLTTRQIAAKIGISQPHVRRIMKMLGTPIRNVKDAANLRKPRETISEIHKQRIANALKGNKNGVDPLTGKSIKFCRIKSKCDYCKKDIWIKKHHLYLEHHYCNRRCRTLWQHENSPFKINPNHGKIKTNCKYCNAEIYRIKYDVKNAIHGSFCNNKKCHDLWRSKNITGNKLYNFRGGYDGKYYGKSWSSTKKKARERDNNTCKKCGITKEQLGKYIDVHHKNPVNFFRNENGEITNEMDKLVNNLDNLVCLCSMNGCHQFAETETNRLFNLHNIRTWSEAEKFLSEYGFENILNPVKSSVTIAET